MTTADETRPLPSGAGGVDVEASVEQAIEAVGGVRLCAARTTWFFHVAVVGFILTGWAWPWPAAWWVYAIGAPFVQIGWVVFKDHCWLSIIEAKLRGETLVIETVEGEEPRTFVGELLESIFKRSFPRWTSNALSYGVLWGGFVASCWRLYHRAG